MAKQPKDFSSKLHSIVFLPGHAVNYNSENNLCSLSVTWLCFWIYGFPSDFASTAGQADCLQLPSNDHTCRVFFFFHAKLFERYFSSQINSLFLVSVLILWPLSLPCIDVADTPLVRQFIKSSAFHSLDSESSERIIDTIAILMKYFLFPHFNFLNYGRGHKTRNQLVDIKLSTMGTFAWIT